jgi:hypothetical protein
MQHGFQEKCHFFRKLAKSPKIVIIALTRVEITITVFSDSPQFSEKEMATFLRANAMIIFF